MTLATSVLFALALALAQIIFRDYIGLIFSNDAEVIAVVSTLVPITALFQVRRLVRAVWYCWRTVWGFLVFFQYSLPGKVCCSLDLIKSSGKFFLCFVRSFGNLVRSSCVGQSSGCCQMIRTIIPLHYTDKAQAAVARL